MIVVAIIGILAAVAIPQYQNYVARAQVSEALVLASGAKTAVAEYASVKGEFPTNNDDAGLEDKDDIKGTYVDTVEVGADGVITATFGDDAHTNLIGGTLMLTPGGLDSGSITWTCTGSTDIGSYLPSSCDSSPAIEGAVGASTRMASLPLELPEEEPEVGKGSSWAEIVKAGKEDEFDACWNYAKKQWEAGENSSTGNQENFKVYARMTSNNEPSQCTKGAQRRLPGQCALYPGTCKDQWVLVPNCDGHLGTYVQADKVDGACYCQSWSDVGCG